MIKRQNHPILKYKMHGALLFIRLWVFASLLCLGFCIPLPANTPTFKFEHLTMEDGLSHNSVHDMAQDHQDFLWIGTSERGLDLFDPKTEIFRHEMISCEVIPVLNCFTFVGFFYNNPERFINSHTPFERLKSLQRSVSNILTFNCYE